jgi:hypothetical protein
MKNGLGKNQIIIYQGDNGNPQIEVHFEGETVWLTQDQMAELFGKARSTITEHIKNIFTEGELDENMVCREFRRTTKHGAIKGKTQESAVKKYNLDVIISVGYRVSSIQGTRFRQWATTRLHEYIIKGFTMDDERLKGNGGGNYWKELLDRIRDIRSSEKVLYRQVLDLYATAIDYDPQANESFEFFKTVQNKLHFAAHGHTASEIVYLRVDSNKSFAGLTSFKGKEPTQAEAMIAKNFLELSELKVLNNLVSAYFDLAEISAIEQKSMRMKDFVQELDNVLKTTGRKLLHDAGNVSHEKAIEKATKEFRKYKAKNLSEVEKSYLEAINSIEEKIKNKLN